MTRVQMPPIKPSVNMLGCVNSARPAATTTNAGSITVRAPKRMIRRCE